jgi:serine/threonine protein phosphatase PrpC
LLNFKYGIRSRAGVNANGLRKINQDNFIAHINFGKKKGRHYFGVCDGHGVNGHFVSGFVKEALPSKFIGNFLSYFSLYPGRQEF